MRNVVDVDTYTDPVQVLEDSDPVDQTVTQPTIQGLANRTLNVKNRVVTLETALAGSVANAIKTIMRNRFAALYYGGTPPSAFPSIWHNARGIVSSGRWLQFSQTGIQWTSDGLTWTNFSLGLSGGVIRGRIASNGGGVLVACADDGTTAKIWSSSDNGTSWTARQTLTTANLHYASVFWDGSLFIAPASGGQLYTSGDGLTWTSRTSQFTASDDIADGAVLGTTRVIVGMNGKLSSSTNGTAWTARASGLGTSLIYRVYACTLTSNFIALSTAGQLITSPDGITWTPRTSNFTAGGGDFGSALAFNGSIIVAADVSTTEGRIIWSTDSITWTKGTFTGLANNPSSGAAGRTSGIVWDGYMFIATGSYNSAPAIWTSIDGKYWTTIALPAVVDPLPAMVDPTTLTVIIPGASAAIAMNTPNSKAA